MDKDPSALTDARAWAWWHGPLNRARSDEAPRIYGKGERPMTDIADMDWLLT